MPERFRRHPDHRGRDAVPDHRDQGRPDRPDAAVRHRRHRHRAAADAAAAPGSRSRRRTGCCRRAANAGRAWAWSPAASAGRCPRLRRPASGPASDRGAGRASDHRDAVPSRPARRRRAARRPGARRPAGDLPARRVPARTAWSPERGPADPASVPAWGRAWARRGAHRGPAGHRRTGRRFAGRRLAARRASDRERGPAGAVRASDRAWAHLHRQHRTGLRACAAGRASHHRSGRSACRTWGMRRGACAPPELPRWTTRT